MRYEAIDPFSGSRKLAVKLDLGVGVGGAWDGTEVAYKKW
jgi:hypothetical protein